MSNRATRNGSPTKFRSQAVRDLGGDRKEQSVASVRVRQIFPGPVVDVDPLVLYPNDERPMPASRPYVLINMVASIDGSCTINGLSAGLGGAADAEVFRAVRASCDWILVAAGTARAERYGIPRPTSEVSRVRIATNRSPAPRLAVVTTLADFDADLPMLNGALNAEERPLIITGTQASEAHLHGFGNNIELCRLPVNRPTPPMVLDALYQRGARTVLCEGGPSWNAQMVASGLVDELCVTISPHLVGGKGLRINSGEPSGATTELQLNRLLEFEGVLCARYLIR